MLYHYTSKAGANGIQKSGNFRESIVGAYGNGVYMTALNPWNNSREHISYNNWAGTRAIEFFFFCSISVLRPFNTI